MLYDKSPFWILRAFSPSFSSDFISFPPPTLFLSLIFPLLILSYCCYQSHDSFASRSSTPYFVLLERQMPGFISQNNAHAKHINSFPFKSRWHPFVLSLRETSLLDSFISLVFILLDLFSSSHSLLPPNPYTNSILSASFPHPESADRFIHLPWFQVCCLVFCFKRYYPLIWRSVHRYTWMKDRWCLGESEKRCEIHTEERVDLYV